MADLTTRLAGATLPGPVLVAAGCAGSTAPGRLLDAGRVDAVTTPSVSLPTGRSGRFVPDLREVGAGVLYAAPGDRFGLDDALGMLDALAGVRARAVVSLAGGHSGALGELAAAVRDHPAVVALEIDLTRGDSRGVPVGTDAVPTARVVGAARRAAGDRTLLAKLTPDVTDIVHIARTCADAGADGVTLVGGPLGLTIDTDSAPQRRARVLLGALSGPAVRPIALRCVWQVHRALPQLAIVGTGGVATGGDALQFLLAGASAVGVGTAVLHDPAAPVRIRAELDRLLDGHGFASAAEAVGAAHRDLAVHGRQGRRDSVPPAARVAP